MIILNTHHFSCHISPRYVIRITPVKAILTTSLEKQKKCNFEITFPIR